MGLLHCPLCMSLAVLSAVRFMAHVVLALQLEMQRTQRTSHPADLLGTIFGL